jgi:hypothetical protein
MAGKPIHGFKECRKCGAVKPATFEYFNKKLNGLTPRCKLCLQDEKRKAWARDADAINAKRRADRDDETRARDRARYASNPTRKRANVSAWREANPEKRKEIDQRHYQKNAEKKRRQAMEWSARNPERKRANIRNWHNRTRRNDPQYRLRAAVSAYVYFCLRSNKQGKKVEDVLGYTMPELRAHLERQFQRGMTWENYGDWHVDHIVPVSSFNFTAADDPDFRACWALTNLRPLWAKDNIAKSARRLFLV